MKRDTRQEILKTAKELFNKHGYNSISTRDISDTMGISKGNLTYHFKKKEDIIEALVEEMHSKYNGQMNPPNTIAELSALFDRVQKRIEENAFYYWHNTQLSQLSERIRNIQNKVAQKQYLTLQKAFERLNGDGILQDEQYLGQYEQLIRVISLTCIYWTPHNKLEQWRDKTGNLLDCVWSIIYPLLTEKGKIEYREQIQAEKKKPCDSGCCPISD